MTNATMKALLPVALALLFACKKDEDVTLNTPTLPITRQIYADFVDADTSALRVAVSRATQEHVPYAWANVSGNLYKLVTQSGNQGNIYRNDHIYFFSNTTNADTITVRLDDVQTFSVNVDPANNGQVVYQTVVDW